MYRVLCGGAWGMEKNRMPNVRNVAKYHAHTGKHTGTHTGTHTHSLDLHMMTKCAQTAANNEKCFQPAAFAGT